MLSAWQFPFPSPSRALSRALSSPGAFVLEAAAAVLLCGAWLHRHSTQRRLPVRTRSSASRSDLAFLIPLSSPSTSPRLLPSALRLPLLLHSRAPFRRALERRIERARGRMKLTPDVVARAPQSFNPIGERQIVLRGAFSSQRLRGHAPRCTAPLFGARASLRGSASFLGSASLLLCWTACCCSPPSPCSSSSTCSSPCSSPSPLALLALFALLVLLGLLLLHALFLLLALRPPPCSSPCPSSFSRSLALLVLLARLLLFDLPFSLSFSLFFHVLRHRFDRDPCFPLRRPLSLSLVLLFVFFPDLVLLLVLAPKSVLLPLPLRWTPPSSYPSPLPFPLLTLYLESLISTPKPVSHWVECACGLAGLKITAIDSFGPTAVRGTVPAVKRTMPRPPPCRRL